MLANWRIGTRVYGGFILILFLMLGVAVIGYNGVGAGLNSLREASREGMNAVRMGDVDYNFEAIRRHSQIYAESGSQENLEKIYALQKDTTKLLEDASLTAPNPEIADNITKMKSLAAEYISTVDVLAVLRAKREALINDDLLPTGDAAADGLKSIISIALEKGQYEIAARAGALQQSLLSARLNAERFFAYPEQRLADAANEMLDDFDIAAMGLVALVFDPKNKKISDEAVAKGSDYKLFFTDVVQTSLEVNRVLTEDLAGKASKFAELSQKTKALQAEINQQTIATQENRFLSLKTSTIVLALIALGLGGGCAFVIATGTSGPITKMTATMTALAHGDKSVDIPALNNKDEIGDMAQAVLVFKENALKVEKMQAEQEEMKRKAEAEKRKALQQLADNFENSVKRIVQSVGAAANQMETNAQSMSAVAEETSRQATSVASSAEETSLNVQTVASSAEELSSSIEEIARQVVSASQISSEAVNQAEHTNEVVESLNVSAHKIGEFVGLIASIAHKTNLLALNATIEAARAGDVGKGFVVVAGEVKNLASQTAKATEEISKQIVNIQAATQEAVEAIKGITGTIKQINEISVSISSAVEQQGAATREIARNVEEAAGGARDVSHTIYGVNKAAHETGEVSVQVLGAAHELSVQSSTLSIEVDNFVNKVRAA